MPAPAKAPAVPRLTYLRIKNYRALRDVEFRDLTPLSVFIGPNGSGKSTVLDALAFLAEAVSGNLKGAWEKRNRFAGMRTREGQGDIEFEVGIGVADLNFIYKLSIDEANEKVFVARESLVQIKKTPIKIFVLSSADSLPQGYSGNFRHNFYEHDVVIGSSSTVSSELLLHKITSSVQPVKKEFSSALAVANLLTSYRYVHLTDDHLKGYSDAGPRERLSANGDNLPNVLYYLHLKYPEVLAKITAQMRRWVPALAAIVPEITSDERLLLRFKDAPFEKPLPARYMSDGTMRLAALLTLLYEPGATGLLGIEEPENELHPQLLTRLAEELGKASETRQLLVATHSPFLLDALEPEQVWILHRGPDGYTQATRTADLPNVKQLVEDGSPLGYLWTSNFFTVGDPLAPLPLAPDAR